MSISWIKFGICPGCYNNAGLKTLPLHRYRDNWDEIGSKQFNPVDVYWNEVTVRYLIDKGDKGRAYDHT